MKKIHNSIRARLFLVLSASILFIIFMLLIINTFIYIPFVEYSKQHKLKEIYLTINDYYNSQGTEEYIEGELEKVAVINGIDIIIKTNEGVAIYASNKDFIPNLSQIEDAIKQPMSDGKLLETKKDLIIREINDKSTDLKFIALYAKLDNGYYTVIRLPISSIEESARLSNTFLYITGTCVIIISGAILVFISRKFTRPILELEEIAKKVADLDFSKRYAEKYTNDEIDNLGISINRMSEELEKTIDILKKKNIGLERDIEMKSKIDEMRKQFISDVSHELKTPIALIQGYAEGLKENVNSDEESRNFYVDVIMDEANKMDTLVKKLLELMKLEYEAMEFNNRKFDISELIKEVIRKSKVMIEDNEIDIELDMPENLYVCADDFYIEKVITNYLTNSIKYAVPINGEKYIKISTEEVEDKIRIKVFNTGTKISEEDIPRIWNRFYKTDISRNREDGSTGIGLAFVKAIMNNYKKSYGVENKENGVEFYFDLDKFK